MGVQADRLYVGDSLVWDASAGVASGVPPEAVAFDCNNASAQSAILAWGPIDVLPGDVLVMAVMNYLDLTVPDGWTLHSQASHQTSPSFWYNTSILTRRCTTAESVSGTVTQAAPMHFQVGVVNMRGVSEVVSRPDLTSVYEKHLTATVTIPGKARPGTVMWAICCYRWGVNEASLPYISAQTRPWSASPGMWAPEWTPETRSIDNSRLGMFLDVSAPGPRTFTSPPTPKAYDHMPTVAVELVGT